MRGPHRRASTVSRWSPGDPWKGWTLVRLLVNGPKAFDRQWLIECACGYQAKRYESDLNSRGTQCVTCANRKARSHGNEAN